MNIQDLTTADGAALLASLPPYHSEDVFALTAKLRKEGFDPNLIATALTQKRLREKAATKFPPELCRRMLFTADGIEQATRHSIALQHATYLQQFGISSIIDFGCGIGADALAFAETGFNLTAVEMDLDTGAAAEHNLAPYPYAKVIHANGMSLNLAKFNADAIWIDPARRKNGKRILDPQKWSPTLDEALKLARGYKAAGIKVAPGISYADLPEDSFVTWISADGDLVEAVIWLGLAAPEPGRAAWIITQNSAGCSQLKQLLEININPQTAPVFCEPEPLRAYLYEPDPAIIRAGLIHQLAAEYQLAPISQKIAYLTGNNAINSQYFTRFQIRQILPLNVKKARKALKALEIGNVEIKKRGSDISPEEFRKALALDSHHQNSATLIATPVMGKHQLILADRCK